MKIMKTKEFILEASTNEILKKQLLNNPKDILKEHLDFELDDNIELKVVFEDKNTKYLVVPYFDETNFNGDILNERGNGPCSTTSPRTHNSHC